MTGPVYQIGDGKTFLTRDQLTRLPSIVQTRPQRDLTDRYHLISTIGLIDALSEEKWLPVSIQEQRVRSLTRSGYQRHLIRFQRSDKNRLSKVGDIAPEICLVNSHDGFSRYKFLLGLFRLICGNGMIVHESQFATISILHLGDVVKQAIEASIQMARAFPDLFDKIQDYREIPMRPYEQEKFAIAALMMKFEGDDWDSKGSDILIGDRTFNLPALLKPARREDQEMTLWTTFNILQEKFTHGGNFERTIRINDQGKITNRRKVSGINGINESLRVNRELWFLMDRFSRGEDILQEGGQA